MIQKFRRKTAAILTIIFWGTLIGVLIAVNWWNYRSNWTETKRLLSLHVRIVNSNDDDSMPAPIGKEQKISKIYSVLKKENGTYEVAFCSSDSDYEEDQLIEIAKDISEDGKREGVLHPFRYLIAQTEEGMLISFMDNSIWIDQQDRMAVYSALIGIIGMMILVVPALLLTKWLTRPVATAFERQKQFISDAGHELKTPLAVMKASLDMLEGECRENKYVSYMKDETSRMTELVHGLLSLSRMEQEDGKRITSKVDFSSLTEGTCLPFECLAFEQGIHLTYSIQEGIFLDGDEKQLRQVIEVLVDNAIKHTNKEGTVSVSLTKSRGKTLLIVKNQGNPIPEEDRANIFERFYRADKARHHEEGRYGLGLAIAKAIVTAHKGRIWVECREGWTVFCVRFS